MRWIRNLFILLLLLILLVIGYLLFAPYFSPLASDDTSSLQSLQFKDAQVRLAYTLDNDEWLSYALQPGEERVRVMSNVLLDQSYRLSEADRFIYAIDYEIYDAHGQRIKQGRFYHRAGQKTYKDDKTGQTYVSTSIYPQQMSVADARIHIINLRGLDSPSEIRFKSAALTYPMRHLVLRAYQKKNIADRKLDYAWQRMGEDRRQHLAKVSVYNADIITEQEKRQLIKNQWAPLGPLGAEGDNYHTQKLYVVREIENDVIINMPAIPPTGLVIYPQRYGMISLPDENNPLKLVWQQFAAGYKSSSTDKVTIEWWGRPASRYKKWSISLSDGAFMQQLDSGVIRLSSLQPVVIRAWLQQTDNQSGSQPLEITPKPGYLRLYSSSAPGLVYKVNHIQGYKTPFRFDLRTVDNMPASSVSYALLDKQDRIIKRGNIKLNNPLSHYDMVVSEPDRWLTDAKQIYFNLPRRVDKIKFESNSTVWIAAYTRPKNLTYGTLDPQTYEQRRNAIPVWFAVRPEQWKNYMLKGRSKLITVQRRPPEFDEQLLAGQYRWDQFYPLNNWKGRYLLNSVEVQQPTRESSIQSRFIPLPIEQPEKLQFISHNGVQTLRPSLIYDRQSDKPVRIKIWLNNDLYFYQWIHDKSGEIHLPYLNSGDYMLRLEVENSMSESAINNQSIRFYINYVNSDKRMFVKRMLNELGSETLQFNVLKEEAEELLALRIYMDRSSPEPVEVSVKINGMDQRPYGPMPDWTISRRSYRLHRLQYANSPILLDSEADIGAERLFFIPLGADLQINKNYRIDISLSRGKSAFISLTRTIPGLYPDRRLYPDVELESLNK